MPHKRIIQEIDSLQVPKEYDLCKVGLTQSMIYSFFTCPISFLISLNRYRRKDSASKMGWGSMFHYLLDCLYNQFKKTGGLLEDKIDIFRLIKKYYKDNPEYLINKTEEEINRREIQSYILIQEYIRFYKKQGEFIDFRVIHIEKEFKLRDSSALLRGKFDGILEDQKNNYWLLEHKTILRIVDEFYEKVLSYDFQSLFYIYCIEKIFDYNIVGVQYNIVRNSGIKRLKNETWKGYSQRFRNEIRKKPKHFFKRFIHPYTKNSKVIFNEQLENVLLDIKRFINNPIIYKRQSSCMRQYKCFHLDACSSGRLLGYLQKKKYFTELEGK